MNSERRIKDSFLIGVVGGILSLVVIYFLLNTIRVLLIDKTGDLTIFRPPAIQMLTMAVNLVIFRVLMINYEKEKTAKGFLFITFILILTYLYFYYRVKR